MRTVKTYRPLSLACALYIKKIPNINFRNGEWIVIADFYEAGQIRIWSKLYNYKDAKEEYKYIQKQYSSSEWEEAFNTAVMRYNQYLAMPSYSKFLYAKP